MQSERRSETKRMDIAKAIQILSPDGTYAFSGTTDNMSDTGIGALVNNAPSPGSNVTLRVFWKEENAPIEHPGCIAWAVPAPNGSGVVRVGIKLREGNRSDNIAAAKTIEQPAASALIEQTSKGSDASAAPPAKETVPPHIIEEGSPLVLSAGGVAIETIVSTIGPIADDNTVEVLLKITDAAFGDTPSPRDDSALPPEEQDWSPHPFQDAWRHLRRYIGPLVTVTARASKTALYYLCICMGWLWRKSPRRFRTRLATVGERLHASAPMASIEKKMRPIASKWRSLPRYGIYR